MAKKKVARKPAAKKKVRAAKKQPTPELELQIRGGESQDANLRVGWRLSPKMLEKIAQLEAANSPGCFAILVTAGKEGRGHETEERQIVPLDRGGNLFPFHRPGRHHLHIFLLFCAGGTHTMGQILLNKGYSDRYELELFQRNGEPWAPINIDQLGDRCGHNTVSIVGHDRGKVEIDPAFFAPTPNPLVASWVNWLHENWLRDECHYRRRAALAFTLKPFLLLGYIPYRVVRGAIVASAVIMTRLVGLIYSLLCGYHIEGSILLSYEAAIEAIEGRTMDDALGEVFRRVYLPRSAYYDLSYEPRSCFKHKKDGTERPRHWSLLRPTTLFWVAFTSTCLYLMNAGGSTSFSGWTMGAVLIYLCLVGAGLGIFSLVQGIQKGCLSSLDADELARRQAERAAQREMARAELAVLKKKEREARAALQLAKVTQRQREAHRHLVQGSSESPSGFHGVVLWCQNFKARVCRPFARP